MGNNKKNHNALQNIYSSIKEDVVFLYLVLLFVVFVFYAPDKFYNIGVYKILFFERVTIFFLGISILLIIATFIFVSNKPKVKLEITDIAFLAFAGWNIISLLFSPYSWDGLLGYETWRTGLLTQLAITAIYFIVKQWANKWKSIITIALIAFTVENILVILQRFGMNPLNLYEGMELGDWNRRNLLGTIGNTNWLCGYMMCLIPVIVWLYIYVEEMVLGIVWGVALFISLVALCLQGSSSGIVALAGILLVCLCFAIRTYKHLIRLISIPFMIAFFWMMLSLLQVELLEPEEVHTPQKVYSYLWIIPTLVLAVIIIFLIVWTKRKKKDKLPSEFIRVARIVVAVILGTGLIVFTSVQFWGAASNNQIVQKLLIKDTWGSNRILLWKETIKHFFQNTSIKSILFGVGPDCYGNWFIDQGIYIRAEGPMKDVFYTNAHNLVLTTLINTGVIGVSIYLFAWISLLVHFLKKERARDFSVLGVLMITGMGINGFFSFQQICATPLFFALLGLVRGMVDKKVFMRNE